jgi:hypothetical protein
MTPESTAGNLCGSRMESVIGMIYKTNKASTIKMGYVSLPNLYPQRKMPLCYKRHPMRRAHKVVQRRVTYPISSGKSFGLNSSTFAMPRCAIYPNSLPKM